jgi:hypothetical protein
MIFWPGRWSRRDRRQSDGPAPGRPELVVFRDSPDELAHQVPDWYEPRPRGGSWSSISCGWPETASDEDKRHVLRRAAAAVPGKAAHSLVGAEEREGGLAEFAAAVGSDEWWLGDAVLEFRTESAPELVWTPGADGGLLHFGAKSADLLDQRIVPALWAAAAELGWKTAADEDWPLARALLLAEIATWTAELRQHATAELLPDTEPRGPWHWFLHLAAGEFEVQALLDPETEIATFEDESGTFADPVRFADVPSYVVRRRG